jgi:hypothetical protein
VGKLLKGLDHYLLRSLEFGKAKAGKAAHNMTADEIAAVYRYTCESAFYRRMNAALRDPTRAEVPAYFAYLRLFLAGLDKLPGRTESLWRGVGLNLKPQYPTGSVVTWWGVSSCTSKLGVAQGFLGRRGSRTLFEVTPARATGIKSFSAFTGEEEYVLAPGTRLKVASVTSERGGLTTVRLQELPDERMVA